MLSFDSLPGRLTRVIKKNSRPPAGVSASVAITLVALIAAPESSARAGFLEDLFNFGSPRAQQQHGYGESWGWRPGRHGRHAAHHSQHRYMYYIRYARHPYKRTHAVVEEAAPDPTDRVAHSVCVRSCDGFFFPAPDPSSGRGAAHQATCASVCPDAEAKLFTIPPGSDNIADAKAGDGELYTQFMAKLAAQQDKPKSCSCHIIADDAVQTKALLNDPTLRPGDSVVTSEGVKVFRGGSAPYRKDAFLSLAQTPNLSPSKRGALAAIDRAIKTPVGRAFLLNPDRRRRRHEHPASAGEQRSEPAPQPQPAQQPQ